MNLSFQVLKVSYSAAVKPLGPDCTFYFFSLGAFLGATAFAGAAMPFLGGRDWTFLAGLGVALGAVFFGSFGDVFSVCFGRRLGSCCLFG